MKRKIKFRGFSIHENDWVYGYFGGKINTYTAEDEPFIIQPTYNAATDRSYFTDIAIKKDTEGQYTGLKDRDGKEIYEGDIVIAKGEVNILYVVKFGQYMYSDACFFLEEISDTNPPLRFFSRGIDQTEIIGNIHQNPELL